MRSVTRLAIRAPASRIHALAADVERWPALLPHYRYVRRVDGAPHRYRMGARRGPIPVRWEAEVRPLPDGVTVEFTHTGGVTRGMEVAWRLVERGDGVTDVAIEHELHLGWPLIGSFAAERIIGPLFIEAIARRTLRRMKAIAESAPAGSRGSAELLEASE
jgi:uncharacterized membrane protein